MNTPWDFAEKHQSPDGFHTVEYEELNEIAMGGPLSGVCYINDGHSKIKLAGRFGGPPVWSTDNKYVAIPKWIDRNDQRIALLDVYGNNLQESKTKYRFLKLESFENGIIKGIDNPIHKTQKVEVAVGEFE
ncbi:hypothetical protein D770_05290 [Flammeovirgaceae bacterium 311]|nr:hypothetical protein D770_05290 [Flammeovirgaceae bacterium 311]